MSFNQQNHNPSLLYLDSREVYRSGFIDESSEMADQHRGQKPSTIRDHAFKNLGSTSLDESLVDLLRKEGRGMDKRFERLLSDLKEGKLNLSPEKAREVGIFLLRSFDALTKLKEKYGA